MQELQKTAGIEIGLLWDATNDLLRQYFVSIATWGLALWERELGLLTDPSRPETHRREIILAKLRGASTATKEMIRNIASTFSGADVRVIEYPTQYHFVVQFVGQYGIPPNMAGLIQAIEDIKPAHLTYSFKYTYTVWNMLTEMTWQQAARLASYPGEKSLLTIVNRFYAGSILVWLSTLGVSSSNPVLILRNGELMHSITASGIFGKEVSGCVPGDILEISGTVTSKFNDVYIKVNEALL